MLRLMIKKTVKLYCVALIAAGLGTNGTLASDISGAELYNTYCAACHHSAETGAPRQEALAQLTQVRIFDAMTSGIMQAQAADLTEVEKRQISKFLSPDRAETNGVENSCSAATSSAQTLGPVHVGGWGLSHGSGRNQSSTSAAIDPETAGSLELDWVFAFPNAGRARTQPTVAGNTLFTADQNGVVYALDADSGCVQWRYQAQAEVRSAISLGVDKNGDVETLFFGDFKANVYAVDVASRELLWRRKVDDFHVATITGSLTLLEDRLIVPVSSLEVGSALDPNYACCKFRGAVVALDRKTGAVIWKQHTTPAPRPQGTRENGTTRFGPSGAPIWSTPTVDPKRGLIYVGTGENYSRPTTNTSDSIIALNISDGSIKWVMQALADDAWNGACGRPQDSNCPENRGPDYDFGAPPILTTMADGRDIILAGQKSGYTFGIAPDTGELLWKSKVGLGGIMGGIHWGMATDGTNLYVPISDLSVYARDAHLKPQSGLHQVDVRTGKVGWSTINPDLCGDVAWRCSPGISAAVTLANGVVFGGGLDGILRAYRATDGAILWQRETNRKFEAVNGVSAEGGAIEPDGPVIVGDRLFITSGYDKFGQKFGNVLLSYKVKGKDHDD